MSSLADACGGQAHLPRFHFPQFNPKLGTESCLGLLSEGLVHATILLSNPMLTVKATTDVSVVEKTPTSLGEDEQTDGAVSSSQVPIAPPTTTTTTGRLSDHLYRHIISYSPTMCAKATDDSLPTSAGPLVPFSLCFKFPAITFGGGEVVPSAGNSQSSMEAFRHFVDTIWSRHIESRAAVASALNSTEEALLLERPCLIVYDASKLDAITADVVFPIYNANLSQIVGKQHQRPRWISLQSSLLRRRDEACRVRPSRPFHDPSGQLIQFLTQRRRDDMSKVDDPTLSDPSSTGGLQFRGTIVQVLRGDIYGVRVQSITHHSQKPDTVSSYLQIGKVVQVHLASVECYNRFGEQDHHAASPPLFSLEDTSAGMVSESWERGFASELLRRHDKASSIKSATGLDGAQATLSSLSFSVPEDSYRLPTQTPVVIADANAGYESYWFAKRHLFGMDVRCVVSYCKPSDKDVSNNTQNSEYSQHEHVSAHVEVLGYCGDTHSTDLGGHTHKLLSPLLQQIALLKQRKDDVGRFKALQIAHTTVGNLFAIPVAPLLFAFGVAKISSCTMEKNGSGTHALLAQPPTVPDHPHHHPPSPQKGGPSASTITPPILSPSTFNDASCEYIQVLQMLHAIISEDRECRVALLAQEVGLLPLKDGTNNTNNGNVRTKQAGLLEHAVQLPTHLQVLQQYVMHGDRSQTRFFDNIQYFLEGDDEGAALSDEVSGVHPTAAASYPFLHLKGLFGNWSKFPWGTRRTIWPPAAHTKHLKPMPEDTNHAGRMAAHRESVLEHSKINDTLSKSMFVIICQQMVRLSISRTIKAVIASLDDSALRSLDVRWVSRLLLRPTASQNALVKSIAPLYLHCRTMSSSKSTCGASALQQLPPKSVSAIIGCFLLGGGSLASANGTPSFLAQSLGASLLFSSSSTSSNTISPCPAELLNLSEMLFEAAFATSSRGMPSTDYDNQCRLHLLPRMMGMYYQDVCPLLHTNSQHLSLTVMMNIPPSSGGGVFNTIIDTINTREIFGKSLIVDRNADGVPSSKPSSLAFADVEEDAEVGGGESMKMKRLVLRASSSCRVTSRTMGTSNRVPTPIPLKMVVSLKCLVGCGTSFPGFISNIIDVRYLPKERSIRYVIEYTIVAQGGFLQWLVSKQRAPTASGSGGWGRTAMIQDSGALTVSPSNTTRDFSLRFDTSRAKDVVDIGIGMEGLEELRMKREELRDANNPLVAEVGGARLIRARWEEQRHIEMEAKRAAIMKNSTISDLERGEALWCLDALNRKRQCPPVTPLSCTHTSNYKTLQLSYNASDAFGRGTAVVYGQPPIQPTSENAALTPPTTSTPTITTAESVGGVSLPPVSSSVVVPPPTSSNIYMWMEVSMNEFYEDGKDPQDAREAFSWKYNSPSMKLPRRIKNIETGKIERQNLLVDVFLPKPEQSRGKFLYVVVDVSVFEQSGGKKGLVKQQRVLYELTDSDNGTDDGNSPAFMSAMNMAAPAAKIITINVDEDDEEYAVMDKGDSTEDGGGDTSETYSAEPHVSPPTTGSGLIATEDERQPSSPTSTSQLYCSKALLRDVLTALGAGFSERPSADASNTTIVITTTDKLHVLMSDDVWGCSVADSACAVGHVGILATVHVTNTISLPEDDVVSETATDLVIQRIRRRLRDSLLFSPASLHPEGILSEQGDFTESATSVTGNIYYLQPFNAHQHQPDHVSSIREFVSLLVHQRNPNTTTPATETSSLTGHYSHLKRAIREDIDEMDKKKTNRNNGDGSVTVEVDMLPHTNAVLESFNPATTVNISIAEDPAGHATIACLNRSPASTSWIVSANSSRACTLLLPQMKPLYFPASDYAVPSTSVTAPAMVSQPPHLQSTSIPTQTPISLSLQPSTVSLPVSPTTVRVEISSYFLAAAALFPRMFAACHRKHHLSIMTKDVESDAKGAGHIDYIFNRMSMPTLRNILSYDFSSIAAGGALPTHLTRDPLLLASNPQQAGCLFSSPGTDTQHNTPCDEPILREGVEQFVSEVRPLSGLLSTLMFALPRAWPEMVVADSGRKVREARGYLPGIYRSSGDAATLRDNSSNAPPGSITPNADLEDKRAYFEATRMECSELRKQLKIGGFTISNKMCSEAVVAALLSEDTDDDSSPFPRPASYPSDLPPPAPLPHQLLCHCPSQFYKRGISNSSVSSDEKKSSENYTLLASKMKTSGVVEVVRCAVGINDTTSPFPDAADEGHTPDGNTYMVYKYLPSFHMRQLMESGSNISGLTVGQVPVHATSSCQSPSGSRGESVSYCARLQLTTTVATKLVTAIGVAALTRTSPITPFQQPNPINHGDMEECRVDAYSNELMGHQGEGVDEGPALPHVAYRMGNSGTVFGDPLSSPPLSDNNCTTATGSKASPSVSTIFDPLSTARVSVVYIPLRLRSSITPHAITKHSSIGQMRRDTIFALLLSARRKGREMLDLCRLWLQTRPSDFENYTAFGDGKLTFYGSSMEPLYVYYRSRDTMRHALGVTWSGSLFPLDSNAAEASYNLVLNSMPPNYISSSSSSSSSPSSFLTAVSLINSKVMAFPQLGEDVKDYISTVGNALSPVVTDYGIGIDPPSVNCWDYFSRLFIKYHGAASRYHNDNNNKPHGITNHLNICSSNTSPSSPCGGDRILWARAEEAATRQLLLDTITAITSIATIRTTRYTAKGAALKKLSPQHQFYNTHVSSSSSDDDDAHSTTHRHDSTGSVVPQAIYLATASNQEENTVRIDAYVVEEGCYDDNGSYTGSFPMEGNVYGRLVSLRFTLTSLPIMLLRELSIEAHTVERLERMGPHRAGLVHTINPSPQLKGATIPSVAAGDSVGARYVGEGKAQWDIPLLPQRDAAVLLSTATGGQRGGGGNKTISCSSAVSSSSKVVGDGSVLPFSIKVEDLRED